MMFFARAAFVLMATAGSASARGIPSELLWRDLAEAASGSEGGLAVASQTAVIQPSEPKAQALYEFMMARRLEAAGDAPGALAALERAKKLDPQSAEISAEIAGYYART